MNVISGLLAIKKLQSLKKGKTVYLSKAEIVNLIINLQDAHKNLNIDKFNSVYSLFKLIERNKEKICFNSIEHYYDIAKQIICCFDEIAPFEYYSGMDSIDSYVLMSRIRKEMDETDSSAASIKANGLVNAVRVSIGDVFYNLSGQNAAISAIISISAALKYYLDKNSKVNSTYSNIGELYMSGIANFCANTEESIHSMIDTISDFSITFEERTNVVKNNYENINHVEACGVAAASLYCNLQKETNDIEKAETCFELFKTVFVELVESL